MAGPLVDVDTQIAAVGIEVDRQLYLGADSTLELLRPDSTAPDGLLSLLILTENFTRVTDDETVTGKGKPVIFEAADVNGNVWPLTSTKDLYLKCLGETFEVVDIPKISPVEAQVIRFVCRVRTRKAVFDEGRR